MSIQQSIELVRITRLLKKHIWKIVVCSIVSGMIGLLVTKIFMKPSFEATTQLVAKSDTSAQKVQENLDAATYNILMTNTYENIIKSYAILGKAETELEKSGIKLSIPEMEEMISVSKAENSQVFKISVISTDKTKVKMIVDKVTQVFSSQIGSILGTNQEVTILSPAMVSDKPVSPNTKLNVTMFTFVGAVIASTFTFFQSFYSRTLKEEEEIADALGLQILGTIPYRKEKEMSQKRTLYFSKDIDRRRRR